MTLRRDEGTRIWSADFKGGVAGRLHVSLRTTRKDEAMRRHAAVDAFYRAAAAHADLVDQLRRRKLTVEAITACVEAHRSFDTLRAAVAWPTMGEARDAYQTWLENHPKRAASTAEMAISRLAAAVEFFGASTRLDEVTPEQAESYQRALAAKYQPGTVRQYLIRLHALYHWAQGRETARAQREKRPARTLFVPLTAELLPDAPEARARFLSGEEAALVLAAAPAPLRFAVGAGLFAGLRAGEVLALRPPPMDLDLGVRVLFVQARDGWTPKTRKNREIPISDAFLPIIERHVAAYASAQWMLPSPVMPGAPLTTEGLKLAMRRIVTDAGLTYGRGDATGVTFHTLRHTFASWMVMEGVDLFTVAKLLGHASTTMVEKVYGHLAPEHRRWAVDRLAKRLPAEAAPDGAKRDTTEDTENGD